MSQVPRRSNRLELAAFVLALRGTPVTKPILYLYDNQVLLKAVKRWVGEGEKTTLVGAPDADILLEAIKELWKKNSRSSDVSGRIEENLQMKKQTSKLTRLFQAKMFPRNGTTGQIEQFSHGKSLAGKEAWWAMKIESGRGTARCRRWLDAEEEVRKHRDRVTGAWKQISKQRWWVDVSYDPSTKWSTLWSKYGNGSTAWYKNGRGEFQKDLYQGEGKRGRHPPAFLRYMGSGLHAETGCRKVYAGEVPEWQKNPMAAKETIFFF